MVILTAPYPRWAHDPRWTRRAARDRSKTRLPPPRSWVRHGRPVPCLLTSRRIAAEPFECVAHDGPDRGATGRGRVRNRRAGTRGAPSSPGEARCPAVLLRHGGAAPRDCCPTAHQLKRSLVVQRGPAEASRCSRPPAFSWHTRCAPYGGEFGPFRLHFTPHGGGPSLVWFAHVSNRRSEGDPRVARADNVAHHCLSLLRTSAKSWARARYLRAGR